MTLHDLYLLSPELSLVTLAFVLLLVDLAVRHKPVIHTIAAIGIIIPLVFSFTLWMSLEDGVVRNTGILKDTLTVDGFSLFFKFILLGAAAIVILMSSDYVRRFEKFRVDFVVLLLFSTCGMMLMASTVELITIYIALELSALPLAALSTFLRDNRSSEAGLKFLVLSGVSSALLLYGMVLVYGFTGTTVLDEIAYMLGNTTFSSNLPFGNYAVLLGITLIVAGFGFKITAVPFQMWAPDVYEGSPTPVTAFLSVASKSAGFAVLIRVFYEAFNLDAINMEWSTIFAILAAISMTIGNLVAIAQTNIKRMLAYSAIAHAGYLMVGLASVSANMDPSQGPIGVLFYLGGYAATNLAAFAAVIAISSTVNNYRIDGFAGMGKRAPLMGAALALALVSLIGVPPTVGFMVKVYIFGAAVSSDLAWLAMVGVLNSVVSAYYYLRVIKIMYLSSPDTEDPLETPFTLQLAVGSSVFGVLLFGVYPTPLLQMAQTAASVLP